MILHFPAYNGPTDYHMMIGVPTQAGQLDSLMRERWTIFNQLFEPTFVGNVSHVNHRIRLKLPNILTHREPWSIYLYLTVASGASSELA